VTDKLVIAIDYDFTYTADKFLFDVFIEHCHDRGHKVICVTGRDKPPCKDREVQFIDEIEIICAGDMEKKKAAMKAGYKVDIWIDDMPETIGPCVKLNWD